MNLNQCRENIDEIDVQILALLNRRAEMSRMIGSLKMQAGLPIMDANRESEILKSVCRDRPGDLTDEAAARIYRQILAESREIQAAVYSAISTRSEIGE